MINETHSKIMRHDVDGTHQQTRKVAYKLMLDFQVRNTSKSIEDKLYPNIQ